MQNLLRPAVARATQQLLYRRSANGAVFPQPWGAAIQSRKCGTRKNPAVTGPPLQHADARSRARKGAENRTQTQKLALHEQPRRAMDCARSLDSASRRLWGKQEVVAGTTSIVAPHIFAEYGKSACACR